MSLMNHLLLMGMERVMYCGGGDSYHSGSPGSEGVVLFEVKPK